VIPRNGAAADAVDPGLRIAPAPAHASADAADVSGLGTRLLSLAALAGLACGIGSLAVAGYRAATDAWVAPVILSPDNDLVLTSRMKRSEYRVERARTLSAIAQLESDLAAADAAVDRLEKLRGAASKALAWTSTVTSSQLASDAAELAKLDRQRALLEQMQARAQERATRAQADFDAHLIARDELDRELRDLDEVRLALLENDRSRLQKEHAAKQAELTQKSLARREGAPPLPERLLREDQLVRVDLELLRLGSEKRAKAAEAKVLREKLSTMEELEAQIAGRPLFRAIERSLDLAFVPYTQMDDIRPGDTVHDCVWGLFLCRGVGTVAELVPGEVILPDPWGNPARGQYAVLDLKDRDAAREKTLRVRTGGRAAPAPAPARPDTGALSQR